MTYFLYQDYQQRRQRNVHSDADRKLVLSESLSYSGQHTDTIRQRSFHNVTLIYCKILCKRFFFALEHGWGNERKKKRKCRPQTVDDERKTTKKRERQEKTLEMYFSGLSSSRDCIHVTLVSFLEPCFICQQMALILRDGSVNQWKSFLCFLQVDLDMCGKFMLEWYFKVEFHYADRREKKTDLDLKPVQRWTRNS